eukprot:2413840-Amphidinium_carterae.1
MALRAVRQVHRRLAHRTQQAVAEGCAMLEDFQVNQEADVIVNHGAAEHDFHKAVVRQFWVRCCPNRPFEVGPHKRVVEFNDCARCLDCFRQTGRLKSPSITFI